MTCQFETLTDDHLLGLEEVCHPRTWVAAHDGHWDHADWLALLDTLQNSEYWPMPIDAVGGVLECSKSEHHNLRRWQESGQPYAWVEAHGGQWNHADWQELLATLDQSEFAPVDPQAVGAALETLKADYWNLRRWQESGQALNWVEAHDGQWNHEDWLALLETLNKSEFGPVRPEAVARVLKGLQQERLNLRRWQESGLAHAWVEEHQGQWNHEDWLALVEDLRQSAFWPVRDEAVGQVVEGLREEWSNLRRWRASGQAGSWVEAHQDGWDHAAWEGLLDDLRATEFWPLPIPAAGRVLEELKGEYHNLQRWQASPPPRLWVCLPQEQEPELVLESANLAA